MRTITHCGMNDHDEEWEVVVTQGMTFRAYDVFSAEVAVEDGVITFTRVPEELDATQARALAAMLKEAADVLGGE